MKAKLPVWCLLLASCAYVILVVTSIQHRSDANQFIRGDIWKINRALRNTA